MDEDAAAACTAARSFWITLSQHDKTTASRVAKELRRQVAGAIMFS